MATAHIPRPRTSNAFRTPRRTLDASPSRQTAFSRTSSHANLSGLMQDFSRSEDASNGPADFPPPNYDSLIDRSEGDPSKQFSHHPYNSSHMSSADVEKQSLGGTQHHNNHSVKKHPSVAAEYEVPTRTKFLYLAIWFALNLFLTIYNKAVLGEFAFPWLLTMIHTSCVSVGCYLLLLRGAFRLSKLNLKENLILGAFSILFTMNIAISNVSLAIVSVPFHQIMRSMCPIVTVLIYRVYYGRSYSTATYLSIIPIILGVALATYGDYYFTPAGFILTSLGVILASAKTVVTNRFMTGSLALPALEVLLRMSPLAAAQSAAYAYATGESLRFVDFVSKGQLPTNLILALFGNGVLAFVLNVSSFQTNKLAGALTLTVSGNLKQCLTILLGIVLFKVKVSPMNGLGMLISIVGAALYSKVELDSKGKRSSGG